MLTDREVLSTLNMLRNEHLDVRTVTLGISLFDCASHDFDVFAYKVRAKIDRYAKKLVDTCNEVGDKFGIPVVNKRISVSPIGVVGASFSRDEMVRACAVLDEAAKNAGVDFLGGFGALVEKGITPGERNLIDALPEALATTDRICSSINVASSRSGINMDAVGLMGQRVLDVAEATRDRDGLGCAKLVIFANIPQDVPFMAGAYLGVGEPDVVINVGVSGPGVVKKAIDRAMRAGRAASLGEVAEVIKRTAYKVTRVGEIIGTEVAQRLNVPFGVADLSLAPTPAVGDSVGEIFQSVGLSSIGAPGSTAVLAMLNDAVKKGGAFASSHVGGLSGAFIPVSEDSSIEAATRSGALTLEKLEAMTPDERFRFWHGAGYDRHPRRHPGRHHRGHHRGRNGHRHDQFQNHRRSRHPGARQGRGRQGGLRRAARRGRHHSRAGRRRLGLHQTRRTYSRPHPQPQKLTHTGRLDFFYRPPDDKETFGGLFSSKSGPWAEPGRKYAAVVMLRAPKRSKRALFSMTIADRKKSVFSFHKLIMTCRPRFFYPG